VHPYALVMAPAGDDHAAPPALRVRVLGGFAVEGVEERALGTRKARLLLKRLAVAQGRPVPAEELAAAVWGAELPAKPNDQVSVLVSRLRSVLGTARLARTDAGAQARAGKPSDPVELEGLVERAASLGGPDAWRWLGELAKATGSSDLWRHAEARAAAVVAAAASRPGIDGQAVAAALRGAMDRCKP